VLAKYASRKPWLNDPASAINSLLLEDWMKFKWLDTLVKLKNIDQE
jgi:hypothetical protein